MIAELGGPCQADLEVRSAHRLRATGKGDHLSVMGCHVRALLTRIWPLGDDSPKAKDSQAQHLWYCSHFQRVHLREKFLRKRESGGSGWRDLQSV